LIKKPSDLRKSNPALGYGSTQQRWMNGDVYIYEHKFYNNVVLVAINKSASSAYNISGLNTALPAGTYADYRTGTLNGSSLTVNSGTGGNNPAVSFNLGANTVSVWQYTAPNATVPQIRHDDRDRPIVVRHEYRRDRAQCHKRKLQRDRHARRVRFERNQFHSAGGKADSRDVHGQ